MKHPIVIDSNGVIGEAKHGIAKYLASKIGRLKLASTMIQPLRTRMDYQSIARKTFLVEALPQKDLSYCLNNNFNESVIPKYKHNEVIISSRNRIERRKRGFIKVGRVAVPTFEIVSTPTIRLHDIKMRRFNLIDR